MAVKLSPANVDHLLQVANGTLVTLERAATVWKLRSVHSCNVHKEGGFTLPQNKMHWLSPIFVNPTWYFKNVY